MTNKIKLNDSLPSNWICMRISKQLCFWMLIQYAWKFQNNCALEWVTLSLPDNADIIIPSSPWLNQSQASLGQRYFLFQLCFPDRCWSSSTGPSGPYLDAWFPCAFSDMVKTGAQLVNWKQVCNRAARNQPAKKVSSDGPTPACYIGPVCHALMW